MSKHIWFLEQWIVWTLIRKDNHNNIPFVDLLIKHSVPTSQNSLCLIMTKQWSTGEWLTYEQRVSYYSIRPQAKIIHSPTKIRRYVVPPNLSVYMWNDQHFYRLGESIIGLGLPYWKDGIIGCEGHFCADLRLAPSTLACGILVCLQGAGLVKAGAHHAIAGEVWLVLTAASTILSVMKYHLGGEWNLLVEQFY